MTEAAAGAEVGPYRIVRALGSGAMGTVYLAEGEEGGPVALKVVHAHLLERRGFFGRFEREAEAGRRVDHPNVVRTMGADLLMVKGEPWCFLVMEYVEGRTLRALLEDLGTVPEALVREIGLQVARGLSAIHEAGVIHRDLKPENVLITDDHRVRIMDLGVARIQDASVALTKEGQFAGSLLYAAPEQLRKGAVGPAADLYSLGVVLQELSTGTNPFRAEDAAGVMRSHLEERPASLTEVDPDLSPFLAEVVSTLLEKEPSKRFASAADLAKVLEEAESSAWWGEREGERLRERAAIPRVPVRRETKVHGREEDLALLRDLWAKAKEGKGSTLLLEGEAGIGKSRLVDAFLEGLAAEDAHVLYGSWPPSGGMGAISDAVLGKFGAVDLADALRPYVRETPALVPSFAAFLAQEAPPPGSAPLSPPASASVTVHLMRGLAAEKPLLWVVEDLHFADADRRRGLLSLARAVEGHRVLLVLTARPGGVPADEGAPFARIGTFRRTSLGRLGAREVVLLLQDAFRSERLAEKLGVRIALKSDGIPFFIFEMIRGLKDRQFITQSLDGSWIESKVIDEIEVPSAIKDLIGVRLEGLGKEERAVLDVGAVHGYEFDPALVAEVLERKPVAVLQDLAQVERSRGVVRASGRRFRFDHHQIQEVVYGDLPVPLRETYHGLLAEALERRSGAAAGDPGALDGALCAGIADHFLRGAQGPRALRYLEAGLAHLAGTWQCEEAVRLSERALEVPSLLVASARVRALVRLSSLLGHLGRREPQEAALRSAVALAEGTGEPRDLTRSLGTLGSALTAVGRFDEARSVLERALVVARQHGERQHEGTLLLNLGNVFQFLGRHREARPYFEHYLVLAREMGDEGAEANALGSLGLVLYGLGRMDEAQAQHEQAVERFRRLGARDNEAGALVNLAETFLKRDRHAEALAWFESGRALAREIGHRQFEASAAGGVGHVLLTVGRHAEGLERTLQAIALSREVGDRWNESSLWGSVAIAEEALGRLDGALAALDRQIALVREIGFRQGEAYALAARGAVLAALGQVAPARRDVQAGLDLAREQGVPAEEAYALAALAALLSDQGERAAAERHAESCLARRRTLASPSGIVGALLTLAALRREAGRAADAQAFLDEATALATDATPASLRLQLAVERALLGAGPAAEARTLLARHRDRLGIREAMAAHFDLWLLTRDAAHLGEAKRLLDGLVGHSPPGFREAMRTSVRRHRAIEEAATGHGGWTPGEEDPGK